MEAERTYELSVVFRSGSSESELRTVQLFDLLEEQVADGFGGQVHFGSPLFSGLLGMVASRMRCSCISPFKSDARVVVESSARSFI